MRGVCDAGRGTSHLLHSVTQGGTGPGITGQQRGRFRRGAKLSFMCHKRPIPVPGGTPDGRGASLGRDACVPTHNG